MEPGIELESFLIIKLMGFLLCLIEEDPCDFPESLISGQIISSSLSRRGDMISIPLTSLSRASRGEKVRGKNHGQASYDLRGMLLSLHKGGISLG